MSGGGRRRHHLYEIRGWHAVKRGVVEAGGCGIRTVQKLLGTQTSAQRWSILTCGAEGLWAWPEHGCQLLMAVR
ncbi:hypothetical protein [Candidatus Methylomirabilis limnetica]|uniref:hypothetical protein n=1 Tax=Candidatus Methylomirabilis limnetica TaxID=2033718 RepID=UPI0010570600|nr:hypothetical protein [Candidatus Methylomirabilis limnetica]